MSKRMIRRVGRPGDSTGPVSGGTAATNGPFIPWAPGGCKRVAPSRTRRGSRNRQNLRRLYVIDRNRGVDRRLESVEVESPGRNKRPDHKERNDNRAHVRLHGLEVQGTMTPLGRFVQTIPCILSNILNKVFSESTQ